MMIEIMNNLVQKVRERTQKEHIAFDEYVRLHKEEQSKAQKMRRVRRNTRVYRRDM